MRLFNLNWFRVKGKHHSCNLGDPLLTQTEILAEMLLEKRTSLSLKIKTNGEEEHESS